MCRGERRAVWTRKELTMGHIKSSIGRSAALAAGLLVSGLALQAARADQCASIHGTLSSTFFTDGCTSPFAFCTAGTITKGGFLNGTDVFTLTGMTPTDVAGEVD